MEVRKATKDDFEKIYGLLTVIFGDEDIAKEKSDYFMKICEFKYVVEEDGVVIGFLCGRKKGEINYSEIRIPSWVLEKFAEITFLGVHPNHYGEGIESKLLREIERDVKDFKNGLWGVCDERQRDLYKKEKYLELSSFFKNEKKMYVMAKCWREQKEFKKNITTRQKRQITKFFSRLLRI